MILPNTEYISKPVVVFCLLQGDLRYEFSVKRIISSRIISWCDSKSTSLQAFSAFQTWHTFFRYDRPNTDTSATVHLIHRCVFRFCNADTVVYGIVSNFSKCSISSLSAHRAAPPSLKLSAFLPYPGTHARSTGCRARLQAFISSPPTYTQYHYHSDNSYALSWLPKQWHNTTCLFPDR